ncbi:hypothetical protein [Novosphingobium sp. TH158]|uniref:hypothetical protein n=1 Tax=Novosphingobium sp. TH158 TaxID=2067455 RepID=UPI000C7D4EE6|nr:hypothetical protein [Novosphingobium sp. TH158]PLK26336.1 hypothetical protein C0V78_05170 [Novosphingobium sp. TH158]
MGELALLIPLAPFLLVGFIFWTRHQQKMAQSQAVQSQVDERQAAYTRELEDRIRVLERIVTDKGFDVASQIEALRDARQIEARLDAREKELGR